MKKHTQNNFLAYLIILGAFFVLIFFTRGIYATVQEQLDMVETQESEVQTAKTELSRLWDLDQDLKAEDSEILQEIRWFSWVFSDEGIINHIYSYAQEVNLSDERIIIRDMSLNGGIKSDLGFTKADINLQVVTSWEDTLFGFLDYLTDSESDYRFYITNFDYDLWETDGNITVNIPLTYYYK